MNSIKYNYGSTMDITGDSKIILASKPIGIENQIPFLPNQSHRGKKYIFSGRIVYLGEGRRVVVPTYFQRRDRVFLNIGPGKMRSRNERKVP